MKAAFLMWKNTRMIILAAVCAAIYGAALIAFKTAIPLIPGITEVRVANIFPMVQRLYSFTRSATPIFWQWP